MNNQVAALQAANIRVATLNSNTLSGDRAEIIDDLCCGILELKYSSWKYLLNL